MNVLIIGDLHSPFIKQGYLEHCRLVYKTLDCDYVVLIGDVMDNHYSSFYDADPDGMSAGDELDFAISGLRPWINAFPDADVCIGNHDRRVRRKAFSSGVSEKWIREYGEVLNAPGWNFGEDFIHDGVLYTHGEGSTSLRMFLLNTRKNVVVGHLHARSEIVWSASKYDSIFAMAVGCGIDIDKYAFGYANKMAKQPMLSCGVVLDGRLPILLPMGREIKL